MDGDHPAREPEVPDEADEPAGSDEPETGPRIDRPTTDEADELADLWVSLAASQRAYGSHIEAEPNRAVAREALARYTVVDGVRVARDPDPVGFVMFSTGSGEYAQDVIRGVVENLFVVPERRGEGIGRALLAAAERALADAGADVVALDVLAGNRAARRFYERAGYRPQRLELEKALDEADGSDDEDEG